MDATRPVDLTREEAAAIVTAMKRLNLYQDTGDIRGFWSALNKARDARDVLMAPAPPDTAELTAEIFAAGESA